MNCLTKCFVLETLIVPLLFGENVVSDSKSDEISIRTKRQFPGYGGYMRLSLFPFFSMGWSNFGGGHGMWFLGDPWMWEDGWSYGRFYGPIWRTCVFCW
ncbi:unnamed protein product [Litomosoides sigmodontis]|uniref:Uncharacterized protein n=1 Tax=Litomosoides sigmodontis TaxID=42156 RepID=A0A3P6TQY4_LITSI|nr:unnamed protein product [Litomosoides sigmodontis]